ncbi:MAG: nitric oxide reductase transcriptional regulator NorR [Methylomicrobium sp.]
MDEAIREVVLSLTANLSMHDRYTEFLNIFARVTGNHACALLRFQDGLLIPVATLGLDSTVLEQQFVPDEHPRLAAIMQSRFPVRFADHDPRPDPYDGLLSGDALRSIGVHACVGCALYNENTLFGVLSADSLHPGAFDHIEDSVFRIFAALATVSLRYESYIKKLEEVAKHRELVASELVNESLQRTNQTLGESLAMRKLSAEIDIVAGSDLTVLLLGETGVGKEVVARIIHARSQRAEQPLVYVNCAAMPESLAESELFGHVKGAFSGANAERAGKFELANGGTLFLDEVGELPLAIQAKLLRAVQFGEIQRLGSDKAHRADVRIIAATNRRLSEEVKEGRFRADLYHRLSVYPLHVAPLRERVEDIGILTRYFLSQARTRLGLKRLDLAGATLSVLENYHWPGNVRELEHVILRAVLRASFQKGRVMVLEPGDLDLSAQSEPTRLITRSSSEADAVSLSKAVDDFQRQLIADTYEACGRNWAQTARRLGVDRGNLHRLIKRLDIKAG